jgi:hypothetical protein
MLTICLLTPKGVEVGIIKVRREFVNNLQLC